MICTSRRNELWIGLLVVVTLLFGGHRTWAQADPFGASGEPAPPAGTAADDESKEGKPDELATAVQQEKDPLVRAILQLQPTTPAEWIQDIQSLINLRRPELAKLYLQKFQEAKPSAVDLAKLQRRFGSAPFLRLSGDPELQPEGAAVATAVMAAVDQINREASRLKALVDQLQSDDAATRRLALVALVRAGGAAAPPLIQALADEQRASARGEFRAALVALGDRAVNPLLASLNSPDKALRIEVMGVLGNIKTRRAAPALLAPALAEPGQADVRTAAGAALGKILGGVPSRDEAIRFLARRLDAQLSTAVKGPVTPDDLVDRWAWDVVQKLPVRRSVDGDDAGWIMAAEVATQLHRIAPDQADSRLKYLATSLEVARRAVGFDQPLDAKPGGAAEQAAAAGTEVLEQVLALALDQRMQGAAISAIELLGPQAAKSFHAADSAPDLLHSSNGQPRLLVRAVRDPARRVQFAAAQAIMRLDPHQSYPGCSHLPEVLGYLAASAGRRKVLLGHPRAEVTQNLAGIFDPLGFEAITAIDGRQLILRAFASPDLSLALISDAIDNPPFPDLVQTLRRDPRTANLPIGLMVREVNQQRAEWLADGDPLTLVFPQLFTQSDAALETRRLLRAAGRRQVSMNERLNHAEFALEALTHLASDAKHYSFYDLMALEPALKETLSISPLAAKTAGVLGLLGSPRAQSALVEFASTHARPLADRQAAAKAFRVAVERRGLLLKRDQLLKQYKIYNDSQILDRDTQTVLASLLDTIEAPTRKATAAAAGK